MKDKHIIVRLSHFLSTGCYTGLVPVAPGTSGTLFAFFIAIVLSNSDFASLIFAKLFVGLAISVVGFVATEVCLQNLSEFDQKDPQQIVVDEIAGYFITIALVPWSLMNLTVGFILFRIFDISKPGIVKKLEAAPGGLGVMLDDIMAGIFAAVCLLAFNAF